MKTVEVFTFKAGKVTLQQNAKSNVIGKGGWSVLVSKPKCTKQLNFGTEYEALVRFNDEVLELISE